MALKNIRVLELAGLAPGPFCGMVLAEFGATVIKIDKVNAANEYDTVSNGKKSLALNLKHQKSLQIVKKLSRNSDVLIEPFRKGVMERLGLSPDILLKENPKLIYVRLSGYGQSGYYSDMPGHDINYLSVTGLLSLFGWRHKDPTPPLNFSELSGGSLLAVIGVLMAIINRSETGRGQVIDANLTDSIAYASSWFARSQATQPLFGNKRGENLLDGGYHFYDTYETKDGKHMAVGALEPQFYAALISLLNLSENDVPQFGGDYARCHSIFQQKFKEKTQEEWCTIFDKTEACVTPVLTFEEAAKFRHNKERETFLINTENIPVPKPAPRMSSSPAVSLALHSRPVAGQHTTEILSSLGYSESEIQTMADEGVIGISTDCKL